MPEPIDIAAWLDVPAGAQTPVRGTCFFGRSSTNTMVLRDEKVSRRHAMIHAQGADEYWLIDLGSANGTYLNGRRVGQPSRLSDYDRIEIGAFSCVFRHPKLPRRAGTGATTEKTIAEVKSMPCWLLVADIQGSTHLPKEWPPEEVLHLTGRWLAACKQIVEDHDGTINKFLGDGFFAYWPERDEAAAGVAKALLALKALQAADAPRFRLVVHHGPVFMGGAATLGEESLLGSAVNFVFRMERMASSIHASRLLSEPAHGPLKTLLPIAGETRQPLPGFDGEFLFYVF